MLQVLNPIWLFGISTILIPLIIHLWNIKTGKTLKVGSIVLIGESSRQNARNLKLTDLLLLFMRCLIIIILSALLAQPVWKSKSSKENSKTWVLAEKENFPETYTIFKSEIDSLINTGGEFHFFDPGFKTAELEEAIKDSAQNNSTEKIPYWSLLKLLDQKIPQGTKAYLFTDNRLNRFRGQRPEIETAVSWKTYTPSDSSFKWLENAYLSTSGGLRTTLTESKPSGTIRKAININTSTTNTDIKINIRNGKPAAELNGQEIIADTTTLKIAIYSSEFPDDAEYLLAAINAIKNYTSRKIRLIETKAEKDLLFWLSAKDIPAEILETMTSGGTILKYANGKTTAIKSWIETPDAHLTISPIPLHKRINYPGSTKTFPIWEDGFGTPLLDLTSDQTISTYTLYTRLNAQWTDLVWSDEFVKLLMPLMAEAHLTEEVKLDRRSINEIEIGAQRVKLETESKNPAPPTQSSDLRHYFWLLLLLIFLSERWLSFKTTLAV